MKGGLSGVEVEPELVAKHIGNSGWISRRRKHDKNIESCKCNESVRGKHLVYNIS